MNAPPFPTNPAFGQYYGNWVWSGSRWVCTSGAGMRLVATVFRASAPYTPSPGLVSLVVECIGGGGAGGAINALTAAQWAGGGGGASGGYSRIALAAGLVLGGVNVTIGAGGIQVAGGSSAGGGGAATSFGAFCLANGGGGGDISEGTSFPYHWGAGGAAAPAGVGDVALAGDFGGNGYLSDTNTVGLFPGDGAGSIYGGGTRSSVTIGGSNVGTDAVAGSGAGGSGASSVTAVLTLPVLGGAGGSGLCIVTEYCWADAMDAGCGCGTTMSGARVALPAGQQGHWGWDGND